MYVLDFTKEHYDALLKSLETEFSPELLRQKKGTIKQAITEHFAQTFQEIILSVYEEHIEVNKTLIDPSKDAAFDRCLVQCDLKLLEIKNNPERYQPVDILWAIPHERRVELFSYFNTALSNEEIKEQIRDRLSVLFELDEDEIILFLRNNIYIRKNVAAQKKREAQERRFAGKSPEEMKELCTDYFPDGIWPGIEALLPDTIEDRLNFSTISNRKFIKTFIPVFRSMVEIMLLEKIKDLGRDDLIAFSGFTLRNNFDAILTVTAKNLLEHIEKRDKNAETFIKYYDGSVIIDDEGKKVVQHAILDVHNQKWNYSSILSILMQWKEAKVRAATYEEKLKQLLERQHTAEEAVEKLEPANKGAVHEIDLFKEKVNNNRKAFKALKTECERSSKIMQAKRPELIKLRDLDRDLVNQLKKIYEKHDKVLKQYSNREKEFQNWHRQASDHAKQFKEVLAQKKVIKGNYDGIIRALITVFAKR